jgi:hypothetical protein
VTIPSERIIETQTWLNEHHGSGHGLFEIEDAGHPTGTWKTLVCPCGARHTTMIDNAIAAAGDAAADDALIDKSWEQFKTACDEAKGSPRDIARGALDPIDAAVDAQLDPLKDELKAIGHKLERRRNHHVWRERHGRTCVCGAKEGDPEPCPGPAIIGRD